jgi:ABC-type transport system involved in multi-copper enzyme maturation permease subunit
MIRTLLWKEYRELRTTAVALMIFALGLLFSLPSSTFRSAMDPETVAVVAVAMVWMAGLIAGAQPFAAEIENRTQSWLDTLPASRWQVGGTKLAGAGICLFLNAVLIFVVSLAMTWIEEKHQMVTMTCMVAFGLSGLGCGLCGSSLAQSPLTAIAWALVFQTILLAVNCIYGLALGILLQRHNDAMMLVYAALCTSPLPFIFAAWHYTRIERRRLRTRQFLASLDDRGWRSLLWLSWRQSRVLCVGLLLATVGLTIGLNMMQVMTFWPPVGLLFGIIAGVVAFGADQAGDSYRFLGDRRIPFGRLWLVKVGMCLAVLLVAVAVQFGIDQFISAMKVWDKAAGTNQYPIELREHFWAALHPSFMFLCPLYGFALAQLLGMIFRKGVIAAVVSIMLGCGVLVVWWPSIIISGLHPWQWIAPPLLLFAASRFAVRSWVAGRIGMWRPVALVMSVALLAIGGMLGGLWCRTNEAPFHGDPFDVAAFERSLPPPEQNESGRAVAKALRAIRDPFQPTNPTAPGYGKTVQRMTELRSRAQEAVGTRVWGPVGKGVWPADDAELNQIVDDAFAQQWFTNLREAVAMPLGMAVGDEVQQNWGFGLRTAYTACELANYRAMQLVGRGEISEAFDVIFVMLDLSRHLRSKAPVSAAHIAASIEHQSLMLMPTLIDAAAKNQEVLEKNLARLIAHVKTVPSIGDSLRLEYIRVQTIVPSIRHYPREMSAWERGSLHFASQVPWEQQRGHEILATTYAGFIRMSELAPAEANRHLAANQAVINDKMNPVNLSHSIPLLYWCPPPGVSSSLRDQLEQVNYLYQHSIFGLLGIDSGLDLLHWEMMCQKQRSATIYQMANAVYQLRHGKPPANPNDLVPDILPELPPL